MKIQGPVEFANFLASNGLSSQDSVFVQLTNCVQNFKSACNCYKKEDKMRMWSVCERLYSDAVKHIVPKLKDTILAKVPERQVSFYTNTGDLIRIVSR